jgi:tetrahydromethanopterin:alpha-L-glutamate ligase
MPSSPEAVAPRPAGRRLHIGLVVCSMDWHARRLTRAFTALGATSRPIRLTACGFATTSPTGLMVDGFGTGLPDAVLVRDMAGASFEAVTLRLGILHAAREAGVLVWNDARAIERCVDKSMTSFLLARAGLPTPPTWAVESRDAAASIVEGEAAHSALVLKPLFGSQGRGLRLIRTPDDLPAPDAVRGVYYLQRFVGVDRGGFRDFRLLVSRGRVIAAMARHSSAWITNVKQGARPVALAATEEMRDVAVRAAAAVGASFAGVDVLYDGDGRLTVLEVNSMPAWSGLQKVTPFDIAGALAADVIAAAGERLTQGMGA